MRQKSIGLLALILMLTISCIGPFPSFLLQPTPTPNTLNVAGVVQVVPPKNLFVSGLIWSPNGEKLAISYSRVPVESSSLFQINVFDIHSGQMSLLQESEETSMLAMSRIVAWLPDGNIVFYAKIDGQEGTWTMSEGGKPILLTKSNVSYFSPKGDRIAFWISEQGQETTSISLYVRSLANGIEEQVFKINEKFTNEGLLEWSPDGNRILFALGFSGVSIEDAFNKGLDLYSIDLSSKAAVNLTNVGQGSATWWPPGKMSAYTSWSPDGKLITYTFWKEQEYSQNGLYIMRSDGSCPMKLFGSEDKDVEEVSWSPDGRWIAFAWGRSVYLLDTAEVLGKDFSKYYSTCP